MARARNIKPGIMENEDLAELDPFARLLFIYLWMLADREGRLEDRPKKIKVKALPYDDVDADALLNSLQSKGFIVRYTVSGVGYIQILSFLKHQKPHSNETPSEIPPWSQELATKVESPCNLEEKGCKPKQQALGPCISDSLIDGLTDCLIPSKILLPPTASEAPSKKLKAEKPLVPTTEIWRAYATAYQRRYGALPVRNAKVNGQLSQLLQRLGKDEAPGVAAWYVDSNKRYYVQKMHPVDCLLADAEALRTEWVTNRRVTETQAREADRLQAPGDMWARILRDAEAVNGDS